MVAILVSCCIDENYLASIVIQFTAKLQKQNKPGGWTYLLIPTRITQQLKPKYKASFRVKGMLDSYPFEKTSILPDGRGSYILAFNASLRKATGKKAGNKIRVSLEVDNRKLAISPDLIACLKEDSEAHSFFKSLSAAMQGYYSKWIENAKTSPTKAKRILAVVTAMSLKQKSYQELMNTYKNTIL
jgi:hypothetical protein